MRGGERTGMSERSFKTELVVDADDDLTAEEKQERILELANEAGVGDKVSYGGEMVRKSVDPMVPISLGILLVSGTTALITLIQYLEERDDVGTGIVQTGDGQLVSAEEIEKTVIENNGGIVLGEVDGDVVIFQEDPDADPMELTLALNVHRETGATGKELQEKLDEAVDEEC